MSTVSAVLATHLRDTRQITLVDLPEPTVTDPTDVVVEIRFAAICGSDLWPYRGLVPHRDGPNGHEFLGRVREVGADVRSVRPGDMVIAPFVFSDGVCDACRRGLQPSCERAGLWGKDVDGAQAEAIRVPFADTTLVQLPWSVDEVDAGLARRLIPLCDVFATGTHGVALAQVQPGDTVVVVGDGAVGISAAAAARRLRAGRVIILGEQAGRLAIAEGYDVEPLLVSRDEHPVDRVRELLGGQLAPRVIECVGMQAAFDTAIDLVRPGGSIGFVGVPHGVHPLPLMRIFGKQVNICGGVAPARHYLPELLDEVIAGVLDLSPLMDRTYALSDVQAGYAAMESGEALKVLLDMTSR